MWTRPDGTVDVPTKNRSWFYFQFGIHPSVDDEIYREALTVNFELQNMNRLGKLFNMGMRPWFKPSGEQDWNPIPSAPQVESSELGMKMQFQIVFGDAKSALNSANNRSKPILHWGMYHFAHSIPYTYGQLQNRLKSLETRYVSPFPEPRSKIPVSLHFINSKVSSNIYFHRCVLAKSIDGLNVDIITISSTNGMQNKLEKPSCIKSTKTPRLFANKPIFLVTARVHPGETVASHMLDGFIDFLLCGDPMASYLLSKFVFKIVPMLNPDGVFRGNYRGDAKGTNLNRVYDKPDPVEHPTIFALVEYIKQISKHSKIQWYFDFHGHANKPGSFLFGNWMSDIKKQMEILKFAKYCQINNPHFEMKECDFSPKGMVLSPKHSSEPSKEGTGRVTMYRITGSCHCYTFEANYHGARPLKKSTTIGPRKFNGFNISDMKMMGKSIAQSVFDMEIEDQQTDIVKSKTSEAKSVIVDWATEKLKLINSKANLTAIKK